MIDVAYLRRDLMDYFGTAKEANPAATIDLVQVEQGDLYVLIAIAERLGFDLENYVVDFDGD